MEKMYQKDINLIKDKAVKAAKNLDSVGVFRMFGSDILKRGNQTYVQCPNPDCGASAKSRDCSVGTTGFRYVITVHVRFFIKRVNPF